MAVRPVRKYFCDDTPDRSQMADLLLRGDNALDDDYDDGEDVMVVDGLGVLLPTSAPPRAPAAQPTPPLDTSSPHPSEPVSSGPVVGLRRFGSANQYKGGSGANPRLGRSESVLVTQERMLRESLAFEQATAFALLMRNFARGRNAREVVATSAVSPSGASPNKENDNSRSTHAQAPSNDDCSVSISNGALPIPVRVLCSYDLPHGIGSATRWSCDNLSTAATPERGPLAVGAASDLITASPNEVHNAASVAVLVHGDVAALHDDVSCCAAAVEIKSMEVDIPLVPISLVESAALPAAYADHPPSCSAARDHLSATTEERSPLSAGRAVVSRDDARASDVPQTSSLPQSTAETDGVQQCALTSLEALAEEEALLTLHYHDMVVRQEDRYRDLQERQQVHDSLAAIPFQRPSSAETSRDIWAKHAQYIAAFEQLERKDIMMEEGKCADALWNFMEIEALGLRRQLDSVARSSEAAIEDSRDVVDRSAPTRSQEGGECLHGRPIGAVRHDSASPPQAQMMFAADADADPQVEAALQVVLQFAALENAEVAERDEIELRQRWYFVKRVLDPLATVAHDISVRRHCNAPTQRSMSSSGTIPSKSDFLFRYDSTPGLRFGQKVGAVNVAGGSGDGSPRQHAHARRSAHEEEEEAVVGGVARLEAPPSAASLELTWYRHESQLLRDECDERSELEVQWLTSWQQLRLASEPLDGDRVYRSTEASLRTPAPPKHSIVTSGRTAARLSASSAEALLSPTPPFAVATPTPPRVPMLPLLATPCSRTFFDGMRDSGAPIVTPLVLKPENAPLSTFLSPAASRGSQVREFRLPFVDIHRSRCALDSAQPSARTPSGLQFTLSQAALRIVQSEAAIREEIVREREKKVALWNHFVPGNGQHGYPAMGGGRFGRRPSPPSTSTTLPSSTMTALPDSTMRRGSASKTATVSGSSQSISALALLASSPAPRSPPPPLPATSRCGMNADGTWDAHAAHRSGRTTSPKSSLLSLRCSPLPSGGLAVSWAPRGAKTMM